MSKSLVVIDDIAIEIGGAGKTLFGLLENVDVHKIIRTDALHGEEYDSLPQDSVFLFGNCQSLTQSNWPIIDYILSAKNFMKIDFDYGFCQYRCRQAFTKFTGKEKWEPFGEFGSHFLESAYRKICYRAIHHFFMSEKQFGQYKEFLPIRDDVAEVLSSSFLGNDLKTMDSIRAKRKFAGVENADKWAIVDGNGGWHSEAKGVYESVKYCKENGLAFEIIKSPSYEEMLNKMGGYKGLVFLPIIDDTCPRIVVEAVLMGLEVIINDNCQNSKEAWFKDMDVETILSHLELKKRSFEKKIKDFVNND